MLEEMKYCLSTVVYPAAREYVPEFFESAVKAFAGKSAHLVVFCHGYDPVLLPDCAEVPVQTVLVESGKSVAEVRAQMFSDLKAQAKDDIYIFTDCDDRIHPQALERHEAALASADFSYGDQHLFLDNFQSDLGASLFSCMNSPKRLNRPEDLLSGNCVGFSALAMSRHCLLQVPDKFPENIPPLDWWLALKLLEARMAGARADVVTDYRLSEDAYGRIFKAAKAEDMQAGAKIVLDVLRHLKESPRVLELLERLQCLRENTRFVPKEVSDKNRMWYQDVIDMADCLAKIETGKASS